MVKKVLIFGAGSEPDDVARWDAFWGENARKEFQHAEWFGMTLDPDEYCPNCIKADFNDLPSLDSALEHGYYDLYMFDWSTVNFLAWSTDHLKVLHRHMKNGAMLLIPLEKGHSRPFGGDLPFSREAVEKKLSDAFYDLGERYPNFLMLGKFFPHPRFPISWLAEHQTEINCFKRKFEKKFIDFYNLELLFTVFGRSNCRVNRGIYPIAPGIIDDTDNRLQKINDMRYIKFYAVRKVTR